MKQLCIFSILTAAMLTGCGKKEKQQESLSFTEDDLSFTADHSESETSPIHFSDITDKAGIDFQHVTGAFGWKWMPETMGSGGGFFDYDNDGLTDIFLVNSSEWKGYESGEINPTSQLYKNNGDGTFDDITKQAGLDFSLYGMGCAFADYDGDGDTDIYLTAVGNNKLLRNDNGRYTDVTMQARVSGNSLQAAATEAWSTSAAWVDVDRDGWLDLFVANYVKWTPKTDIYTTRDGKTKSYATPDVYEGESCRLYRNINGKRFEDITQKAGVLNHEGKSLGVAIADFNNDHWPDIVVANDTQPNFLYINNGDGTFADKAISAGIGYDEKGRARAGMGIDVADIQNNDKLAIAIGNFSQEPVSLYTQTDKDDLFQDRAGAARLTRSSLPKLTFGLEFADLDLDGYQDLIMANGHIEPEINVVQKDITFAQEPQIFYNDSGTYVDISNEAGLPFTKPIVGRGLASADIDRDGDLDLLITENGGSPKLLSNETKEKGRHIAFQLQGKHPNLQAVGAKITIWADSMKQQRMVTTGSSYLSQSDIGTIIFGLNGCERADSVIVQWPTSGTMNKHVNLSAGETYIFNEAD